MDWRNSIFSTSLVLACSYVGLWPSYDKQPLLQFRLVMEDAPVAAYVIMAVRNARNFLE